MKGERFTLFFYAIFYEKIEKRMMIDAKKEENESKNRTKCAKNEKREK
jgi:hypothetical protein